MTEHPLIAFLRARLNEDERSARESMEQTAALLAGIDADSNGRWHITTRSAVTTRDQWGREADVVAPYGGSHARHIVRHDPARVLREVEAKRRMIAECEATIRQDVSVGLAETMLAILAEPYADHPDYPKDQP